MDVIKLDPIKFLSVFPIMISGTKTSTTKDVFYGKKQSFLRFDPAFPNVDPGITAEKYKAHIVAAQHGEPNFYNLSGTSDVMITSQLSGCCLIRQNNTLAHVWPHVGDSCKCGVKGLPGESGLEVQQRLTLSHPNCKTYGKKNYQAKTAYVIGINHAGWKFYAQEQMGNRVTSAFQVLT